MDLRYSIRGLRRDSSNKTAVVPNFALYPRFVGVINSIRLKAQYGLKLCNVLWKLLKFSHNTALRNTREIAASQFSLSFFVLWTHVFSLLAHREFWYMPSTPRGSVAPILPMRWTFFSDCVTFVNFCTFDWSQDFALFRGLQEDFRRFVVLKHS